MTTTVDVASDGDALRFRAIPGNADNEVYRIEVLPRFEVEEVGEEVVDEALDDAVDTFELVQHGDHNRVFFPKDDVSDTHEFAARVAGNVVESATSLVQREREELDAAAFDEAMTRQNF